MKKKKNHHNDSVPVVIVYLSSVCQLRIILSSRGVICFFWERHKLTGRRFSEENIDVTFKIGRSGEKYPHFSIENPQKTTKHQHQQMDKAAGGSARAASAKPSW